LQSPEVWRKPAGENEFWVSAGASQSGGLCAKARVFWDFSTLESRQRILDEDAVAGEEDLESNILSQDFALVSSSYQKFTKLPFSG
jgi:hypothetical protein